MLEGGLLALWLLLAIPCGIVGAIIAQQKNAGGQGFLLGLFFGPLGVLAAFAMDNRPCCPKCHGRLDGRPEVCRHCNSPIDWSDPRLRSREVVAAEAVEADIAERRRLAQQYDQYAAGQTQDRRAHLEEIRRAQARRRGEFYAAAWRAGCRFPGRVDNALRAVIGKENNIIYRFLQVVGAACVGALVYWWWT